MGVAIPIRTDIPAEELRHLTRQESDSRVACRLLALANALDGMSREDAARRAGMDRQTLRDWVIRFNAEGVDGLRDRPQSGRPSWLDDGQLAALKALVLRGPDPERDGVSTWRRRICAGSSKTALASAIPRTACSGCSTTSACRGRRHDRFIPKLTSTPRPASKKFPANLTPVFLPAYSPELNAIERVWMYLRERFLSHRLWPSYDDVLDACCAAWNALLAEPGRIRSLCALHWANTGEFLMRLVLAVRNAQRLKCRR
jgi:Winged helix-turn helix/DDE superfamily endonuclease